MQSISKYNKKIWMLTAISIYYAFSYICLAQQIKFSPEQMIFKGDVVTKSNSIDYCTKSWLSFMPEGSVILGINPKSCNPNEWHGLTANLHFNTQDQQYPIIGVLKISWTDRDGKGLHSPYKDKKVVIQLDGQTIWSKSTTIVGSENNDYYVSEHLPIQLSIVIRDSKEHLFTIIMPDSTAWDISELELLLFDFPLNMKRE
jgi:hypothetical protein